MSDKAVARRYAQALFELAREKSVLDEVKTELAQVVTLIKENGELKAIIQHKLLPPEQKQELFRKVFSGKISDLLLNFLLLTTQKRREGALEAIYEQFVQYANEAQNLLEAEVEAAVELSSEELENIRQALEMKTGKQIEIHQRIQPNLKGGVRVRMGDTVFDGSVTMRLDLLKQRLMHVELG